MDIYIKDTGYTDTELTGSAFPDIDSASDTQLTDGEFKEPEAVLLKVTGFNNGLKKGIQTSSSPFNNSGTIGRTSLDPIVFSLTCTIKKPKDYNNVSNTEDLPSFKKLLRMLISN